MHVVKVSTVVMLFKTFVPSRVKVTGIFQYDGMHGDGIV